MNWLIAWLGFCVLTAWCVFSNSTGHAQSAGLERSIVEFDRSGAPKLSSVGGNVWCRVVQHRDLPTYQKYVAELIAAGGEVHGANNIVLQDGKEWFALVCGKVQSAE